MCVRSSRAAMIAVAAVLISSISISAKAHIVWGNGGANDPPKAIVEVSSISTAATLAFNQPNPTVVSDTGSIPTTTSSTQFAALRVTNVDGSARVVLLLRYSNGSVYAIVNSDTALAAVAAKSNSTVITLTGDFSFGTENGQTVVRQKLLVNGVETTTTWGRSTSIVNAFTTDSYTCRHIVWGGGGTVEDVTGGNDI